MKVRLFAMFAVLSTCAHAAIVQEAYIKASNTDALDNFGSRIATSGNTLVVGGPHERSNGVGVNGDQTNNAAVYAGAAYVFVREGTNWSQQAYLKASNTDGGDWFGHGVSISGDTIVVSAMYERSNARGVNGDQTDNSLDNAGAAYVFVREGTNWSQQAYLKAFSTNPQIHFGRSVAISGDTIVVGCTFGEAYAFVRIGTNWFPQGLLQGPDMGVLSGAGLAVAISGNTAVVGVPSERSIAPYSGAAYIWVRDGTNWFQRAHLKASNVDTNDFFGIAVAASPDTVIVGAIGEKSNATGVNGNQYDNSLTRAGAAYVFVQTGTNWSQQAYLKASDTVANANFGVSVAVMGDLVAIGASTFDTAYTFLRTGTNWEQSSLLKGSNTQNMDAFGSAVAISENNVVVAAELEASNATGVNGDQINNSMQGAGAVYVFTRPITGAHLAITSDGNAGYFIRCNADSGVNYELQRATNVIGPWTTNIATATVLSGLLEFHDTNAPPSQAFYRVVQTSGM